MAEMLVEPVSAIEMPSMPPVTINMVASVTMNEGSFVHTTIKPLANPSAAAAAKARPTPTHGDVRDNVELARTETARKSEIAQRYRRHLQYRRRQSRHRRGARGGAA